MVALLYSQSSRYIQSPTELSYVIILEVNESQSSNKLFIFGSAFQVLYKALTKPV